MKYMDNKNAYFAAVHESGHAVVSHALGCDVKSIEIHYSGERERWEGSYSHRLPGFFPTHSVIKKGAIVAVAGILAQAKMIASKAAGQNVRFATNNNCNRSVPPLAPNSSSAWQPS